MGLNKKALKLAGLKRCGLGVKHLFKSITSLTRSPQRTTEGSFLYAKAHLIPLVKTQWKYGKFPQRPSTYEYQVGEASLLTNVMPKSADPIVKEADSNARELTIEFTALKTGCETLDAALSGGITAGQWSGIHPRQSAITPAAGQAIARQLEAEGLKTECNLAPIRSKS